MEMARTKNTAGVYKVVFIQVSMCSQIIGINSVH